MLASAENINGYQVKYGYYTEEPHRVKSIAEYGDGTKGKSLTMMYGYNSTKLQMTKGEKRFTDLIIMEICFMYMMVLGML